MPHFLENHHFGHLFPIHQCEMLTWVLAILPLKLTQCCDVQGLWSLEVTYFIYGKGVSVWHLCCSLLLGNSGGFFCSRSSGFPSKLLDFLLPLQHKRVCFCLKFLLEEIRGLTGESVLKLERAYLFIFGMAGCSGFSSITEADPMRIQIV